jgi:hypothetical protein
MDRATALSLAKLEATVVMVCTYGASKEGVMKDRSLVVYFVLAYFVWAIFVVRRYGPENASPLPKQVA